MIKNFALAVVFFAASSCSLNRAVIKQDYDFSTLKTICVGTFTSNVADNNSGDAVQSAFVRLLLAKGYRVVTVNSANADAQIEGSVTSFQPERKYAVYVPERRSGKHARGTNFYDLGTPFGVNRVIASNAEVGVYAYMTDLHTGEIIWSDSYVYEGLDLTSALDGVVTSLLNTIPIEKNLSEKKQ
ncbi:MAG: hypothetical protein LBQ47_08425 [Endomicrobium sp.]|jgi:hypothetical protein|nr:hypothetical protein [Endomicrobium sp.]